MHPAADLSRVAVFPETGLPITPPLRNPCLQLEMQKFPPLPAPEPVIIKRKQVFTNTRLEALAGLQHESEEMNHS
jgi:hypothetical protein